MSLSGLVRPWPAWPGEVAKLMRAMDWEKTSLGASPGWPLSLKTIVDLMLPAKAELALFWGPDYLAFYNDAYAATIGIKHPQALGKPASIFWNGLSAELGPLLAGVRATGETFSARDRLFVINRRGEPESLYFDISCSAVRDEANAVAGVLCIVSETTPRVLASLALASQEAVMRKEQEFTRLLLNSTSEGFYAVDRHGVTTLCNAAFLKMLGYDSADEVLGRKLHPEICQPKVDDARYLDADCAIFHAAQTGKSAFVTGEVFYRKDGSPLPVDYRVEPIWRLGVLEGAICTFLDTSERLLGQQSKKAREKAESDLRETHDQLRFAEAAGGIGTFLLEIDSDTLTVSAEFCRLFGLPPSRTLPASAVESLFRKQGGDAFSTKASRQRGDASLNAEYRIGKAATGEVRWISRRAEFVRDEDGRPVWMRGVVQDVTDRKSVEATLRESESRFRVLAQAVPNQVWSATPQGKLDWVNHKVSEYAGLAEEKLLGEGWISLLHPDDRQRVGAQWQRSLQRKTRYETEFRLRRRDGVYRWHLARALPITSEGITRWLGANTDIEELKAAQAELAQLNATLEQRVEQRTRDRDRMWRLATDLIVVTGFDGIIKSVNPAWKKLLGWEERELLDTAFLRLVHEDDRQGSQADTKKLEAGRATRRFENRYRHKDGSYKTIAWIAVPDDERVHLVGRDISVERESALVLKEVEERLRQSQKMEAIGQLTGGIAHDFNNLLQGISGSIDVIRGRLAAGRTDDIGHFMDSATNSAHRAAALIHRLLAFARRQSLASKMVDVNALVVSMEDLMRRTLGEHIELLVAMGEDAWPARSDENQLESALLNLAVNARDAMPAGGTLTIRTANATLEESYTRRHEGLLPGDYTVISVSDTGIGMSPDVLARVFEPFFTTKPIGQGTGLGLSMIYGFAKQSGGHVRIHSHLGQGTEVSLYLPRQSSADAHEEVAERLPARCLQAEGETILVVEDDAAVRMIVLDELNELGYTTLEAVDGPSAIHILHSARNIDILISDVGLPGMNGRQIAEIGRQHRPGLPVLFMTGYTQSAASRSEFLAPGMEMITKPFAMDELAAKIREMLAGSARLGKASGL
ncbi:PAS domain-containing sensor histidine kinase [Polaromonas sp.]|uniref:hybrid sensor histidine kinase/response regulator n=1 Tax=Polaromonas sp. TaxID=1869339 RepID=UPI0018522B91|nr:PAS domain S-box protein [Polaromonas sp.]NML86162.1 PAS domain S-box protein [Polaromonas sp.]